MSDLVTFSANILPVVRFRTGNGLERGVCTRINNFLRAVQSVTTFFSLLFLKLLFRLRLVHNRYLTTNLSGELAIISEFDKK